MKPKELLISTLENHLAPQMNHRGFRLLRSRVIRFKRNHEGFIQDICFFPSAYSRENCCFFQVIFSVASEEFETWQKETGVYPLSEGRLCGGPEDSIPDWPRGQGTIKRTKGSHRSFELLNSKKDALTIPVLQDAILGATVALLDRLSNYDAILAQKHGSARDMFLVYGSYRAEILAMLGRRDEAERVLLNWIRHRKHHGGHTDNEEEVYEILFGG